MFQVETFFTHDDEQDYINKYTEWTRVRPVYRETTSRQGGNRVDSFPGIFSSLYRPYRHTLM